METVEKLLALAGSLSSASSGTLSIFVAVALAFILWKREEKGLNQVIKIITEMKASIDTNNAVMTERLKSFERVTASLDENINQRLIALGSTVQETKDLVLEIRGVVSK